MDNNSLRRKRVSAVLSDSARAAGVNGQCHGYSGGVQAGKHVIFTPEIILVLWDNLFAKNNTAVATVQRLITDLVAGRFMNGLTQYGVQRGNLIATVVISTIGANGVAAPANWDVSGNDDENQIVSWLNDNTVQPAPGANETSRVYMIVLPNSTQLTDGTNSVGGWHKSAKYGTGSRFDNLFWCVVKTIGNTLVQGRETAFVNGFAPLVGHELCEAFSDRDDGGGYIASNNCEIGDICEADASGNFQSFSYTGTTAPVTTWTIEPYWSEWDSSCVHGDRPVSVRKFLAAINYKGGGLRGLGAPAIGLDYIAQSFR